MNDTFWAIRHFVKLSALLLLIGTGCTSGFQNPTNPPQMSALSASGANGNLSLQSGGGFAISWLAGPEVFSSVGDNYGQSGLALLTGLENDQTADQYLVGVQSSARAGIRLGTVQSGDVSFFNAPKGNTPMGTAFDWASNTKLIIKDTGNVGIGTTSPTSTLSVVGSINATSQMISPAFTMTSDQRLKKDIQPLGDMLEKIRALKPVHFVWNDLAKQRGIDDSSLQIGFIAQDIEAIFPEAVKTAPDGYKSVNYSALISPLVQAFKESVAKAQVDQSRLEAEMKSKDAKIESLEKRLEKLERQREH
jgi:hypothetical protein